MITTDNNNLIPPMKDFDPANPDAACIQIQVRADTRLVGKSFLAHAIARHIAQQGYQNVGIDSPYDPGLYPLSVDGKAQLPSIGEPCKDWRELIKYVQIEVLDVLHPSDVDEIHSVLYPIEPVKVDWNSKPLMSLEQAKEVWSCKVNGYADPKDKDGFPLFSKGEGGRIWLDGETSLEELEALLVIGRAQLSKVDPQ